MTHEDGKTETFELMLDAWERFQRAVDVVSKGGPKHKSAKPDSTAESQADRLIADKGGRNVKGCGEEGRGQIGDQKGRAQERE
jgi:hypothetical protein